MPPPTYITLAEIVENDLPPQHFDLIAPADKQRVAVSHMEALDAIPHPEIRRAICEAHWDPRVKVVDTVVNEAGEEVQITQYLDFSQLAVKMLDKGLTVEEIVNHINNLDAVTTRVERQNGLLPPEGNAT